MSRRLLAGSALLALIAFAGAGSTQGLTQSPSGDVVRIGAVAYGPGVVTVFKDLCRYLNRNEFPTDFVLYSNYDALVAALERREVDIAWNTPLAHARYHVQNGCSSKTLVMREVDCNVRSVLVVRADSGINSPKDIVGKKLILGSADAAEATVLPIHYLEKESVHLDKLTIVSLDKELDFKGNPCSSPSHVLKALRDGRGDAGIITESVWEHAEAAESSTPKLKKIWTSPPFSHCVFTASKSFNETKAERFTDLLTAMDPNDPDCVEIMRLEGTKKWLRGASSGFEDLVEAVRNK